MFAARLSLVRNQEGGRCSPRSKYAPNRVGKPMKIGRLSAVDSQCRIDDTTIPLEYRTRLAAQVSKALQDEGLEVWDSDLNLLPGDNWAAEVARALEESEAMVVLMTADAFSSPWVRREMEYALGAKRYSNRLIPVAVGDRESIPARDIPWIIRRLPWVELEDRRQVPAGVERIADAIRSHA